MSELDVVSCPLGCSRAWEAILDIAPDMALLNVLLHIMRAHPECDPLDLLDEVKTYKHAVFDAMEGADSDRRN